MLANAPLLQPRGVNFQSGGSPNKNTLPLGRVFLSDSSRPRAEPEGFDSKEQSRKVYFSERDEDIPQYSR